MYVTCECGRNYGTSRHGKICPECGSGEYSSRHRKTASSPIKEVQPMNIFPELKHCKFCTAEVKLVCTRARPSKSIEYPETPCERYNLDTSKVKEHLSFIAIDNCGNCQYDLQNCTIANTGCKCNKWKPVEEEK